MGAACCQQNDDSVNDMVHTRMAMSNNEDSHKKVDPFLLEGEWQKFNTNGTHEGSVKVEIKNDMVVLSDGRGSTSVAVKDFLSGESVYFRGETGTLNVMSVPRTIEFRALDTIWKRQAPPRMGVFAKPETTFCEIVFKTESGELISKKFTERPLGMRINAAHLTTGAKVTKIDPAKGASKIGIEVGWVLERVAGDEVINMAYDSVVKLVMQKTQGLPDVSKR